MVSSLSTSIALHGVAYVPLSAGARGHRETVDLHLLARAGDQAPAVEAVVQVLATVIGRRACWGRSGGAAR